jgi:MFS family permease
MPPIIDTPAARTSTTSAPDPRRGYNTFLLFVAGLGGLLYGIDVGIIGGALPYLEATSHLDQGQLSSIVAAVLLGSVFSTLFAGSLSELFGRRSMMLMSGIAFSISIPIIALSHSFNMLFAGRLLQGMSGGFVGVVVPLYLAECLSAERRGRGTAAFQWLLTFGIVVAALVGMFFSYRVTAIEQTANADLILQFKDHAWRSIFWVSLPPGLLFILSVFFITESPRWLFKRGMKDAALKALLRSRSEEQANFELAEMESSANAAAAATTAGKVRESILKRKYLVPFLLACIVLACNTGTGINSMIGFNTAILLQSGLSDLASHWGYVIFTIVNFLATMIGMTLVDKKGRKFLLSIGTAGVIVALIGTGFLFRATENGSVDLHQAVQSSVNADQSLTLTFDRTAAAKLLANSGSAVDPNRAALSIIYSYGDYTSTTSVVRSDDPSAKPVQITRKDSIPDNKVKSFFSNPFANLEAAQTAPLVIQKANLAPVPDSNHGWIVALFLYLFVACYALGPGVVVWLALSELMPTRIRSNGMSVALVINQTVSTTLAAIFLPFVGRFGYSHMFYVYAGITVVYFLVAVFLLPETKGKTLEEIEAHFAK